MSQKGAAVAKKLQTNEGDLPPLIVICRDLPGEHPGGRNCWCVPGVFDADDDVGIQRFLEGQEGIVS